MRVVDDPRDLPSSIQLARSEAGAAFGDSSIYLERRLARPRHVEVQLLADHFGTIVPFVERECSIQRRHQKVVEESPSLAVDAHLRHAIATAAATVARSVGYTNAGTIEFLLDEDGSFYFLEMNTRLQVEHPVTEMVTSIDLVHWQIRIARGERLDLDPERLLTPSGHAIECRIYAEDPSSDFLPQAGPLLLYREPSGPGIRIDAGVVEGDEVGVNYDPMLAKLIAYAETRPAALERAIAALRSFPILGIRTNIPFLLRVLQHPDVEGGAAHTSFLDEHLAELTVPAKPSPAAMAAAAMAARIRVRDRATELGDGAPPPADPWTRLENWGR
jgi:acetyl/propionyl-CoA carboxylase alpha subunit